MSFVPLDARDCAVLASACAALRPKAPKLYLDRVVLLSAAVARVAGGPSADAEAIRAVQRHPRFAEMVERPKGGDPLAVAEARLNFVYFREAWEAVPDPTFEEHTAFEKIAETLAEA